ncbi:hypothetical protein N0V84_011802 [Fusarium piperis]|uniref:Cyclin-dependent kinase n=1 Tax=Fusarium piperis TaxID=1435070 RepID=A0A9W8TAI6_9HYPO|nr:hypothetical protein N0V84_011802 [Fusarium piperis]
METCSPSRRRALAPLDSNALASSKTLFKPPTTNPSSGISPVKMAIEGRKRLLEMENAAASGGPAGKRACLGRDEDASERSNSPDVSSVFDTSANDASWATAATEHDAATTTVARTSTSAPASPAPTSRGTLTRQQVRQRAETLRLRLSLANYKLRTGQTAVPLAELQRRPLLPSAIHVRSPTPPAAASPESDGGQKDRRSSTDSQRTEVMPSDGEEEVATLSR